MPHTSKKFVVGNWKMNLGAAAGRALCQALKAQPFKVNVWVAPAYCSIEAVAQTAQGSSILVGSQNCHWEETGAFTGEVSAAMLKEVGVSFVIVGHSERRQHFGETPESAAKRALAVLKSGLKCIFCIGEKLSEREAGKTLAVLKEQLSPLLGILPVDRLNDLILAYEPVWAIGTGKVASIAEISETHSQIAREFEAKSGHACPPILYGGSVTPDNFAEISRVPGVSGALVGGASLQADKFLKIISVY